MLEEYTIKHLKCCDNLDTEIITGMSLAAALNNYTHEKLPINGSCELDVSDANGYVGKYYISKVVKCEVFKS